MDVGKVREQERKLCRRDVNLLALNLAPVFLFICMFVVAFTHHVQISKAFSHQVTPACIAAVNERMQ